MTTFPELTPVTVLTGFLGSGKTTLLRHLLRDPAMSKTAVVVNEFGDVGLDHDLLESAEENIVELSSGCLCCTVRWDLVTTLDSLYDKRAKQEIPPFDRVVVETTGLADPAPILHTLSTDPKLFNRYRLDGVVTTLDAAAGMATLDAQLESVKQAAMADRIVLTKTDLPEADPGAIKARLLELNPAAPVIEAQQGQVEAAALMNCGLYNPETKSADVARWLAEEAYQADHAHEHAHHHDHHHDVNRHDDRIRAFCITRDTPLSGAAFSLFLELLTAQRGPDLLRVKGLLNIAEEPEKPAVILGVQHVLHPVVWLPQWPSDDRRSRLVIIARDLEKQQVERLLDALTGEVVEGLGGASVESLIGSSA